MEKKKRESTRSIAITIADPPFVSARYLHLFSPKIDESNSWIVIIGDRQEVVKEHPRSTHSCGLWIHSVFGLDTHPCDFEWWYFNRHIFIASSEFPPASSATTNLKSNDYTLSNHHVRWTNLRCTRIHCFAFILSWDRWKLTADHRRRDRDTRTHRRKRLRSLPPRAQDDYFHIYRLINSASERQQARRPNSERIPEHRNDLKFHVRLAPAARHALFPFSPYTVISLAPLCLTPGALCIRISSGTSTRRSPSLAKWKCIKRSARARTSSRAPRRFLRHLGRIRIARKCRQPTYCTPAWLHPAERFGPLADTCRGILQKRHD